MRSARFISIVLPLAFCIVTASGPVLSLDPTTVPGYTPPPTAPSNGVSAPVPSLGQPATPLPPDSPTPTEPRTGMAGVPIDNNGNYIYLPPDPANRPLSGISQTELFATIGINPDTVINPVDPATGQPFIDPITGKPVSLTGADIAAAANGYKPGAMDPRSTQGAGTGAGGGGGGGTASGGSGGSSCGSNASNIMGPLNAAFGPNLLDGIADELVAKGFIPPDVAAILKNPNSTHAQVQFAMDMLTRANLPTNGYDLAASMVPNDGVARALRLTNMAAGLIEDYEKNGLTPAVQAGLRAQGYTIPVTAQSLAQQLGVPYIAPTNLNQALSLANLPNGDPMLADMEKILQAMSDLDSMDDISLEEAVRATQDLKDVAEVFGMDPESPDFGEFLTGMDNLTAGTETNQPSSTDPSTPALTPEQVGALGSDADIADATPEDMADAFGAVAEFEESGQGAELDAALDEKDMEAMESIYESEDPEKVSSAMERLKVVAPGISNISIKDLPGFLEAGIRQGSIPESAVKAALGDNYKIKTQQMASLNAIRNLNINSVSSIFSTMSVLSKNEKLMKFIGGEKGMKALAKGFKKLKSFSIPGMDLKSKQMQAVFKKIASIKGFANKKLGKIGEGIKYVNTKLAGYGNKVFKKLSSFKKGAAALKRFSEIGMEKFTNAINFMKTLGPKQLGELFLKFPKIPMDSVIRFLNRGSAWLQNQLNKIPYAGAILNAVGGIQGLTALVSNLSSITCIGNMLKNMLLACDAPLPVCGGGGAAGGATGGGVDNRYAKFCFKGAIKSRGIKNPPEAPNPTELPDEGTSGAMPRDGCVIHKDTAVKSFLGYNEQWLLKDMPATVAKKVPNPSGGFAVLMGGKDPESQLSRDSKNDVKKKGALIDGLGGTTLATGDNLGEGACKSIASNCPNVPVEGPVWNRLKLDACSNQYISEAALKPNVIFNPVGIVASYDETFCQPLRLTEVQCEKDLMSLSGIFSGLASSFLKEVATSVANDLTSRMPGANSRVGNFIGETAEDMAGEYAAGLVGGGGSGGSGGAFGDGRCKKRKTKGADGTIVEKDKYDYEAWRYLAFGYRRVLDLDYMPHFSNSPTKPGYGLPPKGKDRQDNKGEGKIAGLGKKGWQQYGDGMAADAWGTDDVAINDLTKWPYERIFDPSHPFSPRYDTKETDRSWSGGTAAYFEVGSCTVRCSSVPVDVMAFRSEQFSECMGCRLGVNTAIFWLEVGVNASAIWWLPFEMHLLNTINNQAFIPVLKTPLGLSGKWPPCSTKFDQPDKVPLMCAPCTFMSGDPNPMNGVKKCCEDISKPLAPINTLKIRSREKDMPEGYTFKEYFGNHKPYMRWWDTGTEAGSSNPMGDPRCDKGMDDTIVGVGTEKNSCKYGGGDGQGVACIQIPKADSVTSWAELKLYQTRALREKHLNCLVQNEKFFKQMGSEEKALISAGGGYSELINGSLVSKDWPLGWRGYVSAPDKNERFPHKFKSSNFANAISEPYGNLPRGMDNAQPGDILIIDEEVSPNVMPHVMYVKATNTAKGNKYDFNTNEGEFVQVVDFNVGKYPDACGNTDSLGMGPERMIYKSRMPNWVLEEIYKPPMTLSDAKGTYFTATDPDFQLGGTHLCNDVSLSHCQEDNWDKVIIYRPRLEAR